MARWKERDLKTMMEGREECGIRTLYARNPIVNSIVNHYTSEINPQVYRTHKEHRVVQVE